MTRPDAGERKEWRNFGLLFAGVGVILAGVFWWKGIALWWIPAVCAVLFAASGLAVPSLLRPLYTPWMAFARYLGWLNTRILLTVFFVLVITPVGLLFRLFRRDLLEERMGTGAVTYWKRRDDGVIDKSRYENLF